MAMPNNAMSTTTCALDSSDVVSSRAKVHHTATVWCALWILLPLRRLPPGPSDSPLFFHSNVAAARIAQFDLPKPIDVAPQTLSEVLVPLTLAPEEDMPMRYVRALYEGRGVAGAEMELSGILSTHVAMSTTSFLTTYYCWPVTIAVGPGDSAAADVPCFDKLDAPALV